MFTIRAHYECHTYECEGSARERESFKKNSFQKIKKYDLKNNDEKLIKQIKLENNSGLPNIKNAYSIWIGLQLL